MTMPEDDRPDDRSLDRLAEKFNEELLAALDGVAVLELVGPGRSRTAALQI